MEKKTILAIAGVGVGSLVLGTIFGATFVTCNVPEILGAIKVAKDEEDLKKNLIKSPIKQAIADVILKSGMVSVGEGISRFTAKEDEEKKEEKTTTAAEESNQQ